MWQFVQYLNHNSNKCVRQQNITLLNVLLQYLYFVILCYITLIFKFWCIMFAPSHPWTTLTLTTDALMCTTDTEFVSLLIQAVLFGFFFTAHICIYSILFKYLSKLFQNKVLHVRRAVSWQEYFTTCGWVDWDKSLNNLEASPFLAVSWP